ncbi:MAG TPA: HAMP domain-containing sensor histidine kinase [Bacilli bacterium]|nr:HAMP domain-containing sensor histidine kinase [Bacilli bacterium]
MGEQLIKRNLTITIVSLILFFFLSLYITSYYNRKNLEENLINITSILNKQIKESLTEAEIEEIVDSYTNDQTWIKIVVANSLGSIVLDSTNDSMSEIITTNLTEKELEYIDESRNSERVYIINSEIYYITKINDDIIVRTSIAAQDNASYILNSVFYMLILIIFVLIVDIYTSRKTSSAIENAFIMISDNLKTINSGAYQQINTRHKFYEVSEALENINEINKSIYAYISEISNERDKVNFIVNNMQQGLMIINDKNELLIINKYACKLLDAECWEENNNDFKAVITDAYLIEKISHSLLRRKDEYFDYYKGKARDVYSFVLTHLVSKWDKSLEASSLLFISIIDVTEERKNDEIKAEFIVNASHELKTPITTISGFSELILNGAGKCDEKAGEYVRRIYLESIRMKNTIDELLYLSNLEYKSSTISLNEDVDLAAIVNDVVDSYLDYSRKNAVIIEKRPVVAHIKGSKVLIRHLLVNLVENAIKYNRENGKVIVCLEEDHNDVILQVIDTGIGMDESNMNKIFDRFYRIEESRNRSTGGTGLGLTIAKKICIVHGAKIFIDSSIGVGTTFTVKFNKEI